MIEINAKAPLTAEAFARSFHQIMSAYTDAYVSASRAADEEDGEQGEREKLEEFFRGLNAGSLLSMGFALTKIAQVLITEHELKLKRGDFGPAFPPTPPAMPADPNTGLARDDVKCEMHTLELKPGQDPQEAIREFLKSRGVNLDNAKIREIK